ncbi:hypothetical protein [Corynebacterium dentalis]|uniref:hypothetical protein n=1 Tax=Corynebacterium dentalis TaxID=2014528 RepID=UPI0028A11AFC|nr:hypothetical protein [Corynebacterium dentalis]
MTNAVFTTGPVTKKVTAKVEKFRFVDLAAEGVKHASGTALPYGYVRQTAAPVARAEGDVSYGLPDIVAVVTHQAVVEVATAETKFTPGAKVYAAADGKAAASGTIAVGLAEGDVANGRVRVHMFHPAALG